MPNFRDEEEEDSTFDEVSAMADRLGLKGKGRMTYIDDHMMQLGYVPVQSKNSYIKEQQEDPDAEGGGSAGRWGFGRGGGGGGRGRSSRGNRDDDDSF